ncbi:hypothetical protein [Arthrobacter sp. M4]|uniref:hypothetical protein n=1 Tax=Arthrobacter sp. M4 TaxID=218160 RepID=UPI001CDB7BF5|nr:hypothetical protein [Arthrobacter sp. M4]MCA4134862.1 hypothetical protein [Arthrobacter sp. M4]
MSASASAPHAGTVSSPWARRALAGVLGGLAGGIVFGILMAMMGMFTMIAGLVGSNSPWIGVGVHLVISVAYGLVLTLFFSRFLHSYGRGSIPGLVYGVILWVIGPLLVMPLMLGMPVFGFNVTVMMSLVGHLLYGLVVALVAVWTFRRAHA